MHWHPIAFLQALLALAKGIGNAFDNRPVKVCPGMYIAKTDDGTLGLRSGDAHAGIPEGLQHQPHGAGGRVVQEGLEQGFRTDTQLFGLLHFLLGELALEPVHHPVATLNDDFRVVAPRHGRAVGGDKRNGLHVAFVTGIEGGSGAIAEVANFRREGTGAKHFAGLVRPAGDHRQTDGNAGMSAGSGGDLAQCLAGCDQLGELLAGHPQGFPFQVVGRRPALPFVIKRDVAHLGGSTVTKLTGQPIV